MYSTVRKEDTLTWDIMNSAILLGTCYVITVVMSRWNLIFSRWKGETHAHWSKTSDDDARLDINFIELWHRVSTKAILMKKFLTRWQNVALKAVATPTSSIIGRQYCSSTQKMLSIDSNLVLPLQNIEKLCTSLYHSICNSYQEPSVFLFW